MYIKEDNKFIKHSDYCTMQVQYKSIWYDFQIDIDDYEKVSDRHWRVSHKKNKVYALSGSKKKQNIVYLHNYILNYTYTPGFEVDHIDGNSFNNRKSNLRVCTRLENIQNSGARLDNKIGIRGITYNPEWHSYVVDFSHNKQRFYFPHWKTLEEAVYCRKFAEEHFGLWMLNRNPIALKHLILSDEEEIKIKNIVLTNIAKATVEKS